MSRESSSVQSAAPPQAVEENIDAVKVWEQAALDQRSAAVRFSEWVTRLLGGGPSLALHAAWFAFWVLANSGGIPGIEPFDRFPFPLLTTMVSLEAIFLSLFVLASQNRLTMQADKRAELDLQIDLLAEREMTAVLVMVADLARHTKSASVADGGADPRPRAKDGCSQPGERARTAARRCCTETGGQGRPIGGRLLILSQSVPTGAGAVAHLRRFAGRWRGLALALENAMGKYAVAWLLGVPLSVLVVIYLVSHTVCG